MTRAAPLAVAALALAAALPAGCGGGGDEVQTLTGGTEPGPDDAPGPAGGGGADLRRLPPPDADDERVIRGWSSALNAGRYGLAAAHFATPSIVEQSEEIRLPDRRAAIAFNRSLPCRADVTDVKTAGSATVAAFELRPGPGGAGPCEGDARVRFVIERGRIREWRQLREPARPGGDVVGAPARLASGPGGPGAG